MPVHKLKVLVLAHVRRDPLGFSLLQMEPRMARDCDPDNWQKPGPLRSFIGIEVPAPPGFGLWIWPGVQTVENGRRPVYEADIDERTEHSGWRRLTDEEALAVSAGTWSFP